jgi:phosphate transport system ATP-binding protein
MSQDPSVDTERDAPSSEPPAARVGPTPGDVVSQRRFARPAAEAEAKGDTAGATGRHVRIKDLNAWYDDNHAVKSISLEVHPNEVTAVIGPSGCGKSTMVRCLNRMHEEIPGARSDGHVTIDDIDIYGDGTDVVSVRRAVGMVFQKPNPFPTKSVFENVAAGLKLSGARGVNMKQRVEESLRGAGLWEEVKDRLDKPGIGLSGGQQQRLCIARTIAVSPEVVLMDEPCSALDPIATLKIEELIDELKTRYTIIIVTHNMQQAARVSDRTAFMLNGELVEYSPTQTIFTNPNDRRTEEYVSGKFG